MLVIPAPLMSQMIAEARQRQPHEACGLLIGVGLTVQQVISIPNTDPRPEQGFILSPQALVTALYTVESAGQRVIGIYHSHPRSASFPSERDIQGALQWPDVAQVIISLQGSRARVQAWQIKPGQGQVDRVDLAFNGREEMDKPLSPTARLAIMSAALIALLLLVGLSVSLLPVAPVITPVP
jgi:proteasome lid subunit RPN8/RPN11